QEVEVSRPALRSSVIGMSSQVPQQPTTVFQHIPSAMTCPSPPFCPGRVKEDLVELMMIQNTQMHQVIMNNMTMWVLGSFGYSQAPPAAEVSPPPEVFHHYYEPAPFPAYVAWMPPPQPQPAVVYQNGADLQDPVPAALQDRYGRPRVEGHANVLQPRL
uniref:DUF4587 domain-containing protein n=1 Tax=Scleropages formosus TaxID=113540 RepID=A0A8C9SLE4_SCLFO